MIKDIIIVIALLSVGAIIGFFIAALISANGDQR